MLFVIDKLFESASLNIGHALFIDAIGHKPCGSLVVQHAKLLGERLSRELFIELSVIVGSRAQQRPQNREYGHNAQERGHNPKSGFVSHKRDCT